MNVTFRQLRLFLALADTGSVSAAAQRMHVTQPTASMQLKEVSQAPFVFAFVATPGIDHEASMGDFSSCYLLVKQVHAIVKSNEQVVHGLQR